MGISSLIPLYACRRGPESAHTSKAIKTLSVLSNYTLSYRLSQTKSLETEHVQN